VSINVQRSTCVIRHLVVTISRVHSLTAAVITAAVHSSTMDLTVNMVSNVLSLLL